MIGVFRAGLAALTAIAFAAASWAAVPLEDFARPPSILDVSLSPSGKYFAVAERDGKDSFVSTFDAAADKRIAVMRTKEAVVQSVRWLSDHRIAVISNTDTEKEDTEKTVNSYIVEQCLINFVDRDGKNPTTVACFGLDILSLRGPDPDTILVESAGFQEIGPGLDVKIGRGRTDVYTINTKTGEAKRLEEGNSRTSGWAANPEGRV